VLFEKFTHALDREGRLALPARLRDRLGDDLKRGLVLTCGAEPCLVAYTQERFGVLLGQLEGDTGVSRSMSRAFKRALGERTAIVREVTVVGAVDAIEIWDTATYEKDAPARQAAYDRVAPRLL